MHICTPTIRWEAEKRITRNSQVIQPGIAQQENLSHIRQKAQHLRVTSHLHACTLELVHIHLHANIKHIHQVTVTKEVSVNITWKVYRGCTGGRRCLGNNKNHIHPRMKHVMSTHQDILILVPLTLIHKVSVVPDDWETETE